MTRVAERRVRLETDLGNIRPHTQAVFEEFAARYDIHFAWGIGDSGDHKAGKALDLMAYARGGGPSKPGAIRPGWNKTVAEYAWANAKRLGIDYVIYDQLIQSNNPDGYAYGGWKTYTGDSHANHVHISFEESPPAYRPPTTAKDALPVALTNDEIEKIADATARRVLAMDGVIRNRSVTDKDSGAYYWSLATFVSKIENTTDKLAAAFAAFAAMVEADLDSAPADRRQAVREALDQLLSADVDIDVTLTPKQ